MRACGKCVIAAALAGRPPGTESAGQVELMALKVFDKGDNQYRAGKADMNALSAPLVHCVCFE